MVTEWRLNGDGKGGFQSHFSNLSVSLFFLNKIAPDADRTRDVRIKGKARLPLRHGNRNYLR